MRKLIDYLIINPTKEELEGIIETNDSFEEELEGMRTKIYHDERLQWCPYNDISLKEFIEKYADEQLHFSCQSDEVMPYLDEANMGREEKKVFNSTKVVLFDMITVLSERFAKYWIYLNDSIYAGAIDPRCCFVFNENMSAELITHIIVTLKENNDFFHDVDKHYAKGRMHKLSFRPADLNNYLSYVKIGVHDTKPIGNHPFTRDGNRPRTSDAQGIPSI